jgi:hypothetical protein
MTDGKVGRLERSDIVERRHTCGIGVGCDDSRPSAMTREGVPCLAARILCRKDTATMRGPAKWPALMKITVTSARLLAEEIRLVGTTAQQSHCYITRLGFDGV